MDSTRTVQAAPGDTPATRADLIDQIIDGVELVKRGAALLQAAHGNLHRAQYGDPSKVGADRARLAIAYNQRASEIETLALAVVGTLATLDLPDAAEAA